MVVNSSDEFTCTKQFRLDSKEKNYYYDLMYNFLDLLRLTLCVTNSDFFFFLGEGVCLENFSSSVALLFPVRNFATI